MYLKGKLVLCFSSLLFLAAQVNAQDTTAVKAEAKEVKSVVKPYKSVITAKAVTKHGMFTVHKIDDKYFFEIPDSLLKREILLTSRLLKGPDGMPVSVGELVNEKTLSFEKGNNNNIFLKPYGKSQLQRKRRLDNLKKVQHRNILKSLQIGIVKW